MNTEDKTEQLDKTQGVYDKLLSRISQLCEEADRELKQIKGAG